MKKLINFFRDEEGVTAIEYALIAALIGVAIATAVGATGSKLNSLFSAVTNNINVP